MDWDELDPKTKTSTPRALEVMSVAELRDYIVALQAEIGRAQAAIATKEMVKSGAEALFKKP